MSKLDGLRKSIDECDAILKETFIRRFDVTDQVAHIKLEEGRAIFDPEREEIVIAKATAGLDSKNAERITTLWNTIMRMSRSGQYETFVAKNGNSALDFAPHIMSQMPVGDFACGDNVHTSDISAFPFLKEHICVQSDNEAVCSVISDTAVYAVICIDSISCIEKLSGILAENDLFINLVSPTESGQLLVIISKYLVSSPQNDITTILLHLNDNAGELAKYLTVIADRHINISSLRIGYDEAYKTHTVIIDLKANLLDDNTLAVLFQLQTEAPFFKVIGARKSFE